MIGDNGDKDEIELDDVDDSLDESLDDSLDEDVSPDAMPDIGGDTVIDVSGELEAIVEKLEKEDPDEAAHKRAVRNRLEEIAEKRNADLDSTFNIDLDDDL
jgi:vacuolar-type H+-ATPase subunit I/STV1